jgi:murein DD-endopeptidase MepM/ murein hydrolase activator NlpD
MNPIIPVQLGQVIEKNKQKKGIISNVLPRANHFYKYKVVSRFFWGRSLLYKNLVQFIVLGVTVLFFLTGISSRIMVFSKSNEIIGQEILKADTDLLSQGASSQSIALALTTNNFRIFEHTVESGETYDSIGKKYGVEIESIKLSNLDRINYYGGNPSAGTKLRVPEINGVLILAKTGDNIDQIMGRITKGNRTDVIEVNNIKAPDYVLALESLVLIPDGLIKPPPPPIPQPVYTAAPRPAPIPSPGDAVYAGVSFIDPLSHPSCGNYFYSRGFSSWHNGVDLAKGGGCPIRAAASGTVEFAGWSSGGEGFLVRINHGNGVNTLYFHGDGQMWVTPGQQVYAGQDIMNMGCTGYCTGTHLHFSLRHYGVFMDPSPYVPYWRP